MKSEFQAVEVDGKLWLEKVYSLNKEEWIFDTSSDAYDHAVDEGHIIEGERCSMYEGTKEHKFHNDFYSVQDFINDMLSMAEDTGREYSEEYCHELESLDWSELQDLIDNWFKKNLPEPIFFTVTDYKEIWYDPKEE